MCGRFIQSSRQERYARIFSATPLNAEIPPRFNLAPTQPVLVVRESPGQPRHLALVRWGLVPHWSKGPDRRFSMINARAESAHEKPAYRGPLRYRRCLVPTDGFYEWRTLGRTKQPHCIRLADNAPFALAGLWDTWSGSDGTILESCSIIVTAANTAIEPVHDRMPVILPPADWDLWLDPGCQDVGTLTPLLKPCPSELIELFPVSRRVNSPANDDADLLEPLPIDKTGPVGSAFTRD